MAKQEVKIHGIYKHYKGDLYTVEDIARHSETLEKMVVYRALYGNGELWCRPYNLFIDEIDCQKHPEIKQKYRFELQDIESKNIQ